MRGWLLFLALLPSAACELIPYDRAGGDGHKECLVPSHCPGTDDECSWRTCDDGACGVEISSAEVKGQNAGDCRTLVCDGATLTQIPGDDPPDDGNECTLDSCAGGSAIHTPQPGGAACGAGSGTHCNGAGVCAGCGSDDDCPADGDCAKWSCAAGICEMVAAPETTPCGPPPSCVAGIESAPDACDGRGACIDGGGTSCAPLVCDSAGEQCRTACFEDAQCCCGLTCYIPSLQGYGECVP